jgi:hypothetical protein
VVKIKGKADPRMIVTALKKVSKNDNGSGIWQICLEDKFSTSLPTRHPDGNFHAQTDVWFKAGYSVTLNWFS